MREKLILKNYNSLSEFGDNIMLHRQQGRTRIERYDDTLKASDGPRNWSTDWFGTNRSSQALTRKATVLRTRSRVDLLVSNNAASAITEECAVYHGIGYIEVRRRIARRSATKHCHAAPEPPAPAPYHRDGRTEEKRDSMLSKSCIAR